MFTFTAAVQQQAFKCQGRPANLHEGLQSAVNYWCTSQSDLKIAQVVNWRPEAMSFGRGGSGGYSRYDVFVQAVDANDNPLQSNLEVSLSVDDLGAAFFAQTRK